MIVSKGALALTALFAAPGIHIEPECSKKCIELYSEYSQNQRDTQEVKKDVDTQVLIVLGI